MAVLGFVLVEGLATFLVDVAVFAGAVFVALELTLEYFSFDIFGSDKITLDAIGFVLKIRI